MSRGWSHRSTKYAIATLRKNNAFFDSKIYAGTSSVFLLQTRTTVFEKAKVSIPEADILFYQTISSTSAKRSFMYTV